MSPTLGLPCKGEAGLGRTALSAREVERAGVLRRVKEGKLKLSKRCTAAWDQYSPGQAALAAVSRARDRRAESTVLLAGAVIVPSRRDFANECCGWCGTSTAAGWTNGLVRRWPPNTWPAKMAWRSVPGHCEVGCCRRGYGVGSASADRIASGASARHISANWCSWMEVFMLGSRLAVQKDVCIDKVKREAQNRRVFGVKTSLFARGSFVWCRIADGRPLERVRF